jgi:transcription antitermination factor NusG
MEGMKNFFYEINYPVWLVLYTKPNNEKKVYNILQTFQIESFLPTRIIRSKNFKEVEIPLFRSYVFLKTIPRTKHFYIAMDLKGSMGYVKFNGIPSIIDEKEIFSLKRLVENKKDKIFPVYNIEGGKEITFRNGPFAGYTVVVKEFNEKNNLIIAWIKEIFAGSAFQIKKEEFLKWI